MLLTLCLNRKALRIWAAQCVLVHIRVLSSPIRLWLRLTVSMKFQSVTVIVMSSITISERKLNFKMELDVRGQRVNEALENVMHYVDDAIMLNVSSVRIIHGKGTGALREEIQKFLKTTPGVVSAKDESIQLGGSGVTVVTFDK